MRTIGFVMICTIGAAFYLAPDRAGRMLLDVATLVRSDTTTADRSPQDGARPRAFARAGGDAVGTKPWDSVSEIIAETGMVRVTAADVRRDGGATLFTLALSQGLTAEVFTLSDPYRVVIDMPEVQFKLPDGTGQTGRGLVKTFRYGLFSEDKGRIVLDTTGPVRIDEARMVATTPGMNFEIRLVEMSVADFGAGTGAEREAQASKPKPDLKPSVSEAENREALEETPAKPVVVIDPGHGGIDPGAVGVSNVLEKDVVLAVGKALRDALRRTGKFDVHMTRSRDVFLPLSRRVALSRKHKADLFVSLHADSISDENIAKKVSGASVYTLSHRASDALARQMAEKENASDALAGISVEQTPEASDVRSILADLMQRETANFSTEFSNVLLRQLRRDVPLTKGPQRSAAFKVLKQSHAPSVLIELGYMSNPSDENLMRTSIWRQNIANSIAKAVVGYFKKRQARR